MEIIESVLQFRGYVVNEINFIKTEGYAVPKGGKFNVQPELKSSTIYEGENTYKLTLTLGINMQKDIDFPFELFVSMTGIFQFNSQQPETKGMLEKNTTAILFPYLRTLVSSVTMNANIPPFILPTVNVSKMLEKQ
ncbi:protein-export chaperone SecB [Anaerotalea alkaliphila]|uniref:Preprotein translocase subunit SecB n=1 Tax=Anaerotalea alkaliphila TaxID=2662126 RepID=A0A7X5HW79_9FIRM|nr:protein-export chaperone SecB [Anaerotalea alkaliphila]NDL67785.1 hypothetical protein [Anaerotalea alkaliphila]